MACMIRCFRRVQSKGSVASEIHNLDAAVLKAAGHSARLGFWGTQHLWMRGGT